MSDADEPELIERTLGGDEIAFRALYRSHADPLWRFALRLTGGVDADAEELVQETWTRAVRSLARFEHRSTLRTWLFAIASRCAWEEARRLRSDRLKVERLEIELAARTATVGGRSTSARRTATLGPAGRVPSRVDLERALRALPQGFRTVLVLHDVEGLPHRRIAEDLGISTGTSKSQLSRARRRMRELLGEDYVTT